MMSEELCGKWAALNNLLRSWRDEGGNKVLIFTKSVKLLDMLEHHLNRQSNLIYPRKCYTQLILYSGRLFLPNAERGRQVRRP